MRTKIISLFAIIFCLVVLAGCTTSDPSKPKTTKVNMGDFFKEYCDIYVNKFQSKDLESYGIEVINDMGVGYYNTVDECVEKMSKIDKLAEDACEQYGKANGIDCNEARLTRQENYKKNMTKDGCIENGKGNRCFLFDTSQPQWSGADAGQISDANVKYTECLQKVEYACSELPKTW